MKTIFICVSLLFLLRSTAAAQQPHPLEKYLNRDGTLNTPPGFSGSLTAGGWKMQTTPDGAPRFIRSAASDPADDAWFTDFTSGDMQINGDVRAVAVIGNDVYIGGAFTGMVFGVSVGHIVKWDGFHFSTLTGPGLDGTVYALAVIGTDLYAGGDFVKANASITVNQVAKWNGSSWSSLGTGTDGTVYSLATDGVNLYAGGVFGSAGGVGASHVAKWNGSSWSALGSGANATVAALATNGSTVYAGGYFWMAGGVAVNYIARWNGVKWDSLGAGTDGPVSSIALSGPDVYAGGGFTMAGSIAANSIAKWNGVKWDSLGAGIGGSVYSMVIDGSDMYVGGDFGSAGATSAKEVAKWNGSTWSTLGAGMNYAVRGLAMRGGDLIAGGLFRTAGTDSATRVARWNGNKWSPLGLGIGGYGDVYALGVLGSDLYLGGNFAAAGDITSGAVAKWNGTRWTGTGFVAGGGGNPGVRAITFIGDMPVVGGKYNTEGINISYWTGSSWLQYNTGLADTVKAIILNGSNSYAGGASDGLVRKLAGVDWVSTSLGLGGYPGRDVTTMAYHDTSLYAGGGFDGVNTPGYRHIARYDGHVWNTLGSGLDSAVSSIAFLPDGVGGTRVMAATYGHPTQNTSSGQIFSWNGSSWSPMTGMLNGSVTALVSDGPDLYAAGDFTSIDGTNANHIAKWDGTSWSPLGSGIDRAVKTLVIQPDSTGTKYLYAAGGTFTTVGGKPAFDIARWKIPPSKTLAVSLSTGWNLISVPVLPSNDSVRVLFPGATSNAFGYSNGYQISPVLSPGYGYWIKYGSGSDDSLRGAILTSDTIPVATGWNLVGSISSAIPVSSVTSNPPGMVTGTFFGYSGSYIVADSIEPGKGYWVKVNGDGQLVFSGPGSAAPKNRIKIVPTGELPPSPPDQHPEHRTSDLPLIFSLDQNYPNPFNPSTIIRYSLPANSLVSLKVYDLLGQEVATLVDGVLDAGYRTATWNAANFPSGVYFYRLRAGDFVQTRKLAIIK